MCAYFFYKDCCKLGYFYFTGCKGKDAAQVLQVPKGTPGVQLRLLPGALLSLSFLGFC